MKNLLVYLEDQLEALRLSGVDLLPKLSQAEKNDKKILTSELSVEPQQRKEALVALRETALHCTKCNELATKRTHVVFGSGHAQARLMFVGEAPGHDEDLQGLPFVGRAGQLLTQIIESIGLKRQEVFIANVLKCRPPGNQNPQPDEILNCEPYLVQQIKIIQPKVICALGAFAAQTLLKSGSPISALRGRFHDYHGIKVMCTFHPAYLLRNSQDKRKTWEDMKMIREALHETG